MPCVGKENVKVYVEQNTLVIKGEAESESDDEGAREELRSYLFALWWLPVAVISSQGPRLVFPMVFGLSVMGSCPAKSWLCRSRLINVDNLIFRG
ncbi:hypothetical protein RJ640_001326 [Escallonia rubra]|uniref:SHSP domain-containing protein n=1 Tax=Escallonia rubra TaxID=112253 RepID=A0AA88QXP3_9ASTE|nr:hypothetical protein RJ640_001326 [Escallonia rubra]